jgi:hypothetical protein
MVSGETSGQQIWFQSGKDILEMQRKKFPSASLKAGFRPAGVGQASLVFESGISRIRLPVAA